MSQPRPAASSPDAPDVPVMPAPRVQERRALGMPGLPFLLIALLVVAGGIVLIAVGGSVSDAHPGAAAGLIAAGIVVVVCALVMLFGLTQVAPGQARAFAYWRQVDQQIGDRIAAATKSA